MNTKKSNLLILIAVAVVVIAVLAIVYNMRKITPETATAQELYDARTDYVGDNSEFRKLIGLVGYPEDWKFESFELYTDYEPYMVFVDFKTDYIDLDNIDTAKLEKNSMLLLALIGDLYKVSYFVSDENISTDVSVSRTEADKYLGCSVSGYGESVEKVQELLDFSIETAVTAPDDVVKTAEKEIELRYNAALVAMPEYKFDKWRLNSLYEVVTNEEISDANLRFYSMKYSFWANSPDNIAMAEAGYFQDDGWFCPTYDGSTYLVYDSETGEYLFPFMVNEKDDYPKGMAFSFALLSVLESKQIDHHIDTTSLEMMRAGIVMNNNASPSDIANEGIYYPASDIENAFGNAVLKNNEITGIYDYAIESHNILAIEDGERTDENGITTATTKTAYGVALNLCVNVSSSGIEEVSGGHMPIAVTFDVLNNGQFVVSDYWRPRDGSCYETSIRDRFPDDIEDEAMNTQKYILPHMQDCYRQAVEKSGMDTVPVLDALLDEIMSSPKESSNPSDYIDAHPIEYREMTYYDEYMVRFIENEFNENGQIGLRGEILALMLNDLKE